MTPLGHIAISHLVGRTAKFWLLPLVVLGSLLPDIDALFLFFPWFNEFHRTVTHSLVFAAGASGLAALLSPQGKRLATAASLFLGLLTHLLADSVMDSNPSNGTGVMLWWPFGQAYFSPFNLTPAHGPVTGWRDLFASLARLARAMLWEMPLAGLSGWVFIRQQAGIVRENRYRRI
jgi:membrane-bound metal-dependent hydrolase YbcI (DUF457 family)